jgi:hypothetical protein
VLDHFSCNLCLQVLQPHCFSELTNDGTTWTRTPYRAFYRAMYGIANTLRKIARWACACGRHVCYAVLAYVDNVANVAALV